MKQLLLLLLLLCSAMTIAQNIQFPDPNFKTALLEAGVDLNGDGQISITEAEAQDSLILPNALITSIEGIEHFKNLLELDCNSNFGLDEVKIKGLKKLIKLKIYDNNIRELELEDLPELRSFVCNNAGLVMDTLDVSHLPNLRFLYCYWNTISAIKLAPESPMFQIYCHRNPISELDLSYCPKLQHLFCNQTGISELDLSLVPDLVRLDISDTRIRNFDISNNLNLTHLLCSDLSVFDLDISAHILLEKLHCNENFLSDIDVSQHPALFDFNVADNNLTSIDVTNNLLLEKLNVSRNDFSASGIDISNNIALTDYNCERTQLSNPIDLSHCPELKNVNTGGNLIGELVLAEQLDSLKTLICYENGLSELDVFSYQNLEVIDCSENNLGHLDLRNNRHLILVEVAQNPLITFFVKNGSHQRLNLRQNQELEYVCHDIQDTLADSFSWKPDGCIFNSFCYYNPEGRYNNITGKAIYDMQGDGCDDEDPGFRNLLLEVRDSDTGYAQYLTNESGDYTMSLGPGEYSLEPLLEKPDFFSVTPETVNAEFLADYEEQNLDLCVSPLLDICDMDISIRPIRGAVPGFTARYSLTYSNTGTNVLNGRISLSREAEVVAYTDSQPVPNFANETTLFWDFADLLPFETKEILIEMELNRPTDTPPLQAQDVLEYKAKAQVIKSRQEFLFFEDCLNQTVVNSYDPNDKTCLQGNRMREEMVGDYISYLIRFENTGTSPAINITVTDTLDASRLIPSTLKVLDSSHPMFSRIESDNVAQFIFEDIWLSHEDDQNDGYVLFKIKTRENMEIGDEVINNADIYFDYNFPVVTEEYITTVSPLSGELQLSEVDLDLVLFPNPADEQITIWSEENMYEVILTDIRGQKVLERKLEGNTFFSLDIRDLLVGPYNILIKGETQVTTKKLVITR